jgi:sn-glycerol 3-phosphate transport system substrate-binding protein
VGDCPPDADGRVSVTARSVHDLLERRGGTPVRNDVWGEWSFEYELEFDDGETSCTQFRQVHYVDGDGAWSASSWLARPGSAAWRCGRWGTRTTASGISSTRRSGVPELRRPSRTARDVHPSGVRKNRTNTCTTCKTDGMWRIAPARVALAMALSVAAATVVACSDATANGDADTPPTQPGATSGGPDTTPTAPTSPSTPTTDAGSGSGSESEGGTTGTRCDRAAASNEPVDVVVWHSVGQDAGPLFDDLLAEFTADHPGISITSTFVGGYTNALQRLRTTDRADLPHLFMGQADSVRLFHDADLFVPPGECSDTGTAPPLDDLLPVVRATYTVDGAVQAYPFNVSTPVLMFDRARVERAGFDADRPPADMDELRTAITQMIDTGATVNGLVLYDRSASWFIEQWSARAGNELLAPRNGHDAATVDAARFVSDVTVEALGWLRDLTGDGLATWIGLNTSGVDDLFAMVDEATPAAFTLHTSAAIGDILRLLDGDDNPFPDVRLGVAPLPFPGTGSLVGGGGFWLVDRGDPAATGGAAVLGEWLLAPAQQARFSKETGTVPATMSAAREPALLERWAEAPVLEVAYRQLADTATTPAALGMQTIPRVEIQRVLELAAGEAVTSDRDLTDILRDAEVAATELIERYRAAD